MKFALGQMQFLKIRLKPYVQDFDLKTICSNDQNWLPS